jgi:hypothetical protein
MAEFRHVLPGLRLISGHANLWKNREAYGKREAKEGGGKAISGMLKQAG